MRKFNPFKKLLTGIVLFASFYGLYNLTGGADGLYDVQKYLEKNTFEFMGDDFSVIFSNLAMIAIAMIEVYCFVSGMYRIVTCNINNPVFDNVQKGGVPVKGSDSYPNINRILSYRESKLSSMNSDEGADLYIGSAKLESLYTGYNNGPETQRILSFIESKLSSMSPDRGLNYLANKL